MIRHITKPTNALDRVSPPWRGRDGDFATKPVLRLIEPGVVQLNKWRPDPGDVDPGIEISSWAGLGFKR